MAAPISPIEEKALLSTAETLILLGYATAKSTLKCRVDALDKVCQTHSTPAIADSP